MSEKSRCGSPLPEGGCLGGTSTVFRSVRSLHEEYRFEEDKDKIGHGAFSIVYRATPVARTVAMERTWQTAVAASHDYNNNNNNNNGPSTLHSSFSLPSPTSSPSSLYVALKVLPRDVRNEEKAARQRRDVQREAVVLSSIRGHKGCTMLVETLQTEQHFAIVMLLVDRSCVDCGQYLAANTRLTEPHAALIVYQLLRTVQSLHRDVHLLHHDVKLENIVLSSSHLPPVPTTATTLVGLLGSDADGSGSGEPAPSLGASRCHSADSLQLLDGGGLLPSTPPSVGSDVAVISEGGCGHSSSFSAPPSLHLGTVGGPCKSGQNDPLLLACKSKSSSYSVAPRPPLNVPTTVVPSAPATVQRNVVVADNSAADEVVFMGASTTVPRQHRHVVLIDFGLARFLDEDPSNGPCMSSSPHHDHHHPRHPEKKNSSDDTPHHPHCSHHHHHRTLPSSSIVHVGCCGTDRYLPSELLEMSLSNDDGVLGTGVDPSTTVPSKEMSSEQACKVDGYAIGVVTYLLLSGCFPYGAKTKPLLYRQQRLTPLRMDSAAWRSVSSVAKEFVKGLLATDPATRWTTQEALQHPWMQEARSLAHFLKVPVDQ